MNRNNQIGGSDPQVGIIDDGRQVRISASLPGVSEEQIRIDLEKTTLTLSISGDRKMKRVIRIPDGARLFKKKFTEGSLEIVLEKAGL